MFAIYFAAMISNFIAPYVYKKMGMAMSFRLPVLGYLLVIVGNILASLCLEDKTHPFCNVTFMWSM